MKAWLCDDPSGVDALRLVDLPTPEPAPGQVRVRVHAASLNFPDLLTVQGKYQIRPALPFVPGSEYSGTVEAVGAGVTEFGVGDPVISLGVTGGFATHAVADANHLIRVSAAMDLDDAAAFVFTYGTSWHALHDRAALRRGETVLVLGAAGGVGSAAVQIAVAAGARVIAAASSAEKCDFCRRLGAHATIELGREDLRAALKAHTDGRGPDIVYDPVGGDWAELAFRSIAWRGRYLVVGFAGGAIPALPFNLPLLKGASIVGVFWGDFVRREAAAFRQDLQHLFDGHATGALRPAIDQRFALADLPQAYGRMASRRVQGKLLVCPQR
ncbi:MAG TPA: NADPH:quinone oxidoreductase family protein [Burkholderiaceae bacterium]|nr:NADPH:quinone oxidoreductase family protein [Burkholderiaceae bacterium]